MCFLFTKYCRNVEFYRKKKCCGRKKRYRRGKYFKKRYYKSCKGSRCYK